MSESEEPCPVGGCDYSGVTESVKNHITAKTDDAHKGKKGEDVVAEAKADEADAEPAEAAEKSAQDTTGGADGGGGGSLVWVIGAGLVGLYLWLTGQQQGGNGGPENQNDAPEVL